MVSEAKSSNFTFLPVNKEKLVETDSAKLSVLCYNILASIYSNPKRYPLCDLDAIDSVKRPQRIVEEFKDLNADIVCLQEAEEVYTKELEALDYEVFYSKRRVGVIGCMIGIKKTRGLKFLETQTLDMDLDHKFSSKRDFIRGSLAAYVKVEDTKTNKIMHVVNTHFYYDPKFDYVKYLQMYLILQLLNTKAKGDETLIFCGDLNSFPNSNAVNLVLKQEPPTLARCDREFPPEIFSYYTTIYDDFTALKSPFKWEAAYENYKSISGQDEKGGFPTFTNYTDTFQATIDYIFYTPKSLKPLAILRIPTPEEIADKTLPNVKHPSDHLPIMAIFDCSN